MRKAATVGLLALNFGLSACGGDSGGVASTPTSPAPPPSSLPSNANTSLSGTLLSENFTNDASAGVVNYPKTAVGATASLSASTLTVVYDASTRTYTLTNGARSQGFAPTDVISSTSPLTVFKRVSGSTTDTLTLTQPGTSGTLTYRYVGAGYWQRTIDGASSVSGSLDAFTYGVETPDASLPRTGSAGFAIDLLAVIAPGDPVSGPYTVRGSGSLFADFARGTITTSGTGLTGRADGGALCQSCTYDVTFGGSGTISSASNSFTGTMSLTDMTGALNGRFYGPGADEVGAAFSVSANGRAAIGTITGRRDSSMLNNSNTLASLSEPTSLTSGAIGIAYSNVGGVYTQTSESGLSGAKVLDYTPAAGGYDFKDPSPVAPGVPTLYGVLSPFSISAVDLSSSQTDGRFAQYQLTQGATDANILIYKGASNPELVLSYTSFADITAVQRDAGGTVIGGSHTYVPFGIGTPLSQIPRSGTANYSGIIRGAGITGDQHLLEVTGTSSMTVDFAAQSVWPLQLTINPVAHDLTTSLTTNLDPIVYSGLVDYSPGYFTATSPNGRQAYGQFFGPLAQETAGTFSARKYTATPTDDYEIRGVFVAKAP